MIGTGWHTFVQVGLALARIRDARLYRCDYDSFEAYCRAKWEYRQRQIYYLISAAQRFTHLCTNCCIAEVNNLLRQVALGCVKCYTTSVFTMHCRFLITTRHNP